MSCSKQRFLLYLNARGHSIKWHGDSRLVRFFFKALFHFSYPEHNTFWQQRMACWEGLTGSWQRALSLGTAWNWQVIKIWSKCSERRKWRFRCTSGSLNSVLNKWLELADKAEIRKPVSLQPLPLSAVLFQFSKAKIAQLLRLYLLESTQMALTASPWISSLCESLTAWLAIT